ncbi:MAG: hypothetical protein JO165_03730 [Candidatus Eremiobacteraeota bacterium]|nr:hypothetical protein [Candidatus Eremiobacteraeota bacterium]
MRFYDAWCRSQRDWGSVTHRVSPYAGRKSANRYFIFVGPARDSLGGGVHRRLGRIVSEA